MWLTATPWWKFTRTTAFRLIHPSLLGLSLLLAYCGSGQCCLEKSVLSAEAAYSPQDVTAPRLVRLSERLGVDRLREVLGHYWNVVALSLNQLKCSGFFFLFLI